MLSRVDVLEGREKFQALDLVHFFRRATSQVGPTPLTRAAVTVEQSPKDPLASGRERCRPGVHGGKGGVAQVVLKLGFQG